MTITAKEIQQETIQRINEIIKNGVIEMEQKPERDHDFFYLDDANQNKSTMAKHLKRRIKPYTSTRIKARNFLSNVAYSGVKSEEFVDNNFVFDIITLLTKNINPFSLERKIKLPISKIVISFICFGMDALKKHSIDIFAKIKILCISMVKMCFTSKRSYKHYTFEKMSSGKHEDTKICLFEMFSRNVFLNRQAWNRFKGRIFASLQDLEGQKNVSSRKTK